MSGFDINTVTVSGNLTREPELRNLPNSDQSVCSLRIAHNDRRKAANGEWVVRPAVLRRHDLGRPRRVDGQERHEGREGRRLGPPEVARVGRGGQQAPGGRHHRRQRDPRPAHERADPTETDFAPPAGDDDIPF